VADRPDEGADLEFVGCVRKLLIHPPHPSPLPRGKRVQLENQLRGRGDNRKKIHTIISDRVKYSILVPGLQPWNATHWRLLPPARIREAGASEQGHQFRPRSDLLRLPGRIIFSAGPILHPPVIWPSRSGLPASMCPEWTHDRPRYPAKDDA